MFIFVQFYCFEQKGLFTTNPNFPLDLPLFELVEKKKSKYYWAFLERVNFWTKKGTFLWIYPKIFKTKEKHSLAVCGSGWGEKQFLLIFVPFYCFDQKKLFKWIQIFLRIFPFSNLFRKTHFPNISLLLSEKINFFIKKRIFAWIFSKMLQSNREAYFSCMWLNLRRKTFLFIFGQFYCFEQKGLFTTNPNFLLDLLLFKLVEKNKLSEYFRASFSDIFFGLKRVVFSEIAQKFIKTTGKHCLAVCGSFWGEKQFLLIFVPFYCFVQKGLFTTNQNFPLDFPLLELVEKNKLSKYYSASFWESQFFD